MAKRVYVGVSANYSEVEYIQSSGTQYIDTDFKPNQNTRVVMDCDLIAQGTVYTPFGTWNDANVDQYICLSYTGMPSALYHGNAYQTGTTSLIGRHTIDANQGVLYLDGNLEATCATATYSCLYPLYLFTMNDKGKPRDMNMSWMKLYSCQIYDNGTLVRDYVPCENSSGVGGLYDKVSGQFFANAGAGSFTVGAKTGVSYTTKGVARKTKKMYLGIRNVAHKVKKGYIGIGGVARPFFSGGEVAYYGKITALSIARDNVAGASVGNFALFGGGTYGVTSGTFPMQTTTIVQATTVDAYNKKLTRSTPTVLSYSAEGVSGVGGDNYAVFAGGLNKSTISGYANFSNVATANAYDKSLTRTTATSLSRARYGIKTARAGSYGLFAGGSYYNSGYYPAQNVDAYNPSLTRTTATAISTSTQNASNVGTSFGDYALFQCYSGSPNLIAYNSSLTKTDLGYIVALNGPSAMGAASTGTHAIFAGGINGTVEYNAVYAYDESFTKTVIASLPIARGQITSASLGENAIFAGGCTDGEKGTYIADVDVYDASLTRKTMTPLSSVLKNRGVATIGDYALFAGGNPYSDIVEAYVLG